MLKLSLYMTPKNVLCFVLLKIRSLLFRNPTLFTKKCPGCGKDYVEKTDRCVIERLNEHSNRSDQPIFQYLQ